MVLDLASCRSGRDGDLDARERWRCGFSEVAEISRRPRCLAISCGGDEDGRRCSCSNRDRGREMRGGRPRRKKRREKEREGRRG